MVTAPRDTAARALAEQHGARLFLTDAWWKNGSAFNKAAGLNAALLNEANLTWVLLLDSDILLLPPPPGATPIAQLDCDCLYGAIRVACLTPAVWTHTVCTGRWGALPEIPLLAVRAGKYGASVCRRRTSNSIAMQGYFQLWNYRAHPHVLREYATAADYDMQLALRFPDKARRLLPWPGYAVIHVGEARRNWSGRVTDTWDVSPLPLDLFNKYAATFLSGRLP